MVPKSLIPTLGADADAAIRSALAGAVASGGRANPGEVDYIAAVVQVAVKDIASRWSPHVQPHGLRIDITGVFCHATPQVRFPYPGRRWSSARNKRRELADLLVVHDDASSGSATDRVAVLVQAKCDANGRVASPDRPQLHLYEHWPKFESVYATFPQWRRDFSTATTSGVLLDCGRYGIIHTGGTVDWFMVPPAAPPLTTTGNPALGSFMAEMLSGPGSGHGREAVIGGADHWSKTIDDLLTITGVRTFRYAGSPSGTAPRGVTGSAMMAAPSVMPQSGPPAPGDDEDDVTSDEADEAVLDGDGGPDGPPPKDQEPRWQPSPEGINTIYMVTRPLG